MCVEKMRYTYKILVGISERKIHVGRIDIDERVTLILNLRK
jgi:hypothetical protein